MTLLQAHLLAAALLSADMLARAARIHLFLRGAGQRVGFGQVFVANAFGDAAAAVTPMRLGGEGARLVGLLRAGVPFPPLATVLAVEVAAYTVVVAAAAGVVGWLFADDWWSEVGPEVTAAARRGAGWLALLAVLVVLALLVARWLRRRGVGAAGRIPRPSREVLRGTAGWPLALSAPLTLASVAARVAILPVLAYAWGDDGTLPVLVTASFALTYGQFLLPTPAGAGAVELAFAGGVAGEEGAADPGLMLAWRLYTFVLPVALGFGLAALTYGVSTLRSVVGGRAGGGE
jgi:uncharacterized membrane protein YbhN (UPF0104 family)